MLGVIYSHKRDSYCKDKIFRSDQHFREITLISVCSSFFVNIGHEILQKRTFQERRKWEAGIINAFHKEKKNKGTRQCCPSCKEC